MNFKELFPPNPSQLLRTFQEKTITHFAKKQYIANPCYCPILNIIITVTHVYFTRDNYIYLLPILFDTIWLLLMGESLGIYSGKTLPTNGMEKRLWITL